MKSDATANTSARPALAEGKRLMDFCDVIVKAVAKIDTALQQSKRGEAVLRSLAVTTPITATAGGDGKPELDDITKLSDEELKKRYIDWVKEMKYAHYNWEADGSGSDGPSYKHYYSREAMAISSFPSRNTAIMKEVTPTRWASRSSG